MFRGGRASNLRRAEACCFQVVGFLSLDARFRKNLRVFLSKFRNHYADRRAFSMVEFDKKEVYLGRRRRDTGSSRYRKNFVNEVRSDEEKSR